MSTNIRDFPAEKFQIRDKIWFIKKIWFFDNISKNVDNRDQIKVGDYMENLYVIFFLKISEIDIVMHEEKILP